MKRSINPVRLIGRATTYAVLILFLLISILPIYWMWQAALVPASNLNMDPFAFPTRLTLQNIVDAWNVGKMRFYLVNSVFVTIPRVAAVLTLSALAGFSFGKLQFPGKDIVFKLILFGLMIPIQAMIIPIYYNLQSLGLINTRWAMIIPYFGLSMPFATFLMRSFFRDLPNELMDSTRMDGCNELTAFLRVMLPLALPGVMSLLVFEFMWSWNDFFLPLLTVYSDEKRTLPIGLMFYFGKYTADHSLIAAGATISTLPIVIIYAIFQRRFVEGITTGALKG